MKRIVCVLLIILLWAAPAAQAEEKPIPLPKGWGIIRVLKSNLVIDRIGRKCTDDEANHVWRLVAKDSGLEGVPDKKYDIGQPIIINRGCDGDELLKNNVVATVDAEKTKSEDEKSVLEQRLQSQGKELLDANATSAENKRQLDALRSEFEANGYYKWQKVSGGLGILLLGVMGFLIYRLRKHKRQERELTRENLALSNEIEEAREENRVLRARLTLWDNHASSHKCMPLRKVVSRNQVDLTFNLFEDATQSIKGFECPECETLLPDEHQCEPHVDTCHADLGQFQRIRKSPLGSL